MGNRRRKKLNPKYASLPWNIHFKKRKEEEKQLKIAQENLVRMAKLEEEQILAETAKRKELARVKLEEDNRKALEVAVKLKREEEMKALALEAERQRQAKATKAVAIPATKTKTATKKRSTKAKKPVVTMSSEANETPKPKRKYTRKTKSVK